ncbi:catalytic ligB subunit of aromatic ring-opening dioxygenase domain-containing protein [Phthorimaea operculella]|nr:catalytic ligB subunit of aromatic ring-opening dioxygenase domain-containing protein [Phthorimaea operculella]
MCSQVSSEYFAPSLFLNHGGGPYPVLREKDNVAFADFLTNVSQIVDLSRLRAIIIVTAHREEDVVTISSGKHHDLVYDYSNFPPETYKYKYKAEGDPELARRVQEAFQAAGMKARLDPERGWDHGTFIPMMLINPAATIPIIQISIHTNQDAQYHYKMGEILYQFRKEGIAIFGSGMSYHNMHEFRKASDNIVVNEEFDNFLNDACTGDLKKRKDILNWESVPGGLEAHPRWYADHLMPLIVNAGAGGIQPGRKVFETIFRGKFKMSGFIWDQE